MPSDLRLLASALVTAERGWPVFPVRPNDKRPAFPDHTEAGCTGRDPRCRSWHQGWEPRATTDPERIHRAWSRAPYNVGVATGPAGLVVIDLDTAKAGQVAPPEWRAEGARSGADVLAVLAERAGQPVPTDTYTVATPSGGKHLYFTAPAGVRLHNTARKLGWLIDTRAHGGYVLAAGSTINAHPYPVAHHAPVAPLPQWLFQRLLPAPAPARPAAIPVPEGRRARYLEAVLTRQAHRVATAPTGQRNHTLYLSALILGQFVAGGALTAHEVEELLKQATARHIGVNGFTAEEATKTITSGLRAGSRQPRTLTA